MEPLGQDDPDRRPVTGGQQAESDPRWGPLHSVLFRFLFSYLILYSVPFVLNLVPVYGEVLRQAYMENWRPIPLWMGEHVFGIAVRARNLLGGGDRTFTFILLFCYLLLALAIAAVWTLLDRRRANDARLHRWLRAYVRFALAAEMIRYGAFKVIPEQFGTPFPNTLLEPIGDSSPMGLLWTFMGVSIPYVIFTGVAELLGALLLTARRTTLLGALICIGVLSNVVLLNLSFDVPVKVHSSHLLLMALFLAAPDLPRLASLFLWNRRVPPAPQRPLFAKRLGHRAAMVFRTVFVVYVTLAALQESNANRLQFAEVATRQRLYGAWEVEEFAVDGAVRPLLATDPTLWRRLVYVWPGGLGIQYAHETAIHEYELRLDPGPYRFALVGEPELKASLSFQQVERDVLVVEGTVDGKPIRGRFRRMDDSRFPLLSRGFHWVNEVPYHR